MEVINKGFSKQYQLLGEIISVNEITFFARCCGILNSLPESEVIIWIKYVDTITKAEGEISMSLQ
jgi:hypothetical protein